MFGLRRTGSPFWNFRKEGGGEGRREVGEEGGRWGVAG